MMRLLACLMLMLPLPALAGDFVPVKDRSDFIQAIQGRELRLGLFNVSLVVAETGKINGSALGYPITGEWVWKDGFFCREMDWSGKKIDYNCQLVEATTGKESIRFTVDQGSGRSATFSLE